MKCLLAEHLNSPDCIDGRPHSSTGDLWLDVAEEAGIIIIMAAINEGGLDVDWLLHSKKGMKFANVT